MNGAVVKEYPVQTKLEIAQQICEDHRPSGPDGASNMDRLAYVCEVFGTDTIDLDAHYDFANINACKDLDMVEACKHLCLLKMQYTKEMVDFDFMDPMAGDIELNFLTLVVQRINWHLQHLGVDRVTPPFPGLN
jgi:hypothetical protein